MDKKLSTICNDYNINLIFITSGDKYCIANGEDIYENNSYMIGNDELQLGMYDNEDIRLASMFHEIGHTLVENDWMETIKYNKVKIEAKAWELGFVEAEKYGFKFNQISVFNYVEKCLQSYEDMIKREKSHIGI